MTMKRVKQNVIYVIQADRNKIKERQEYEKFFGIAPITTVSNPNYTPSSSFTIKQGQIVMIYRLFCHSLIRKY